MLKGFIYHIQFLTRIPIPFAHGFNENRFLKSFSLVPLVGLVIGACLTIIPILANRFNLYEHRLLLSFLIVLFEVVITGALHLDGLADTFDGLFSYRDRARILEIMKDSTNGTNGTLALVLIILLKILLISKLEYDIMIAALLGMPVISRMILLWASGISEYARENGIAKKLVDSSGIKNIIISTIITVIVFVFVFKNVKIILSLFVPVLLFCFIFVAYVQKKIGGITGDILGALVELSEIVLLVSLLIVVHLLNI